MNPLIPDRSSDRANSLIPTSMNVVSVPFKNTERRPARWIIVIPILIAFVGGYALSAYLRPVNAPPEPKIQIEDFRVTIPEGETSIAISSREGTNKELARLTLTRQGNQIHGIPERVRQIQPRTRLSAEDAAFFRKQLSGVTGASDSDWIKANKIRDWLAHQPHHIALPGLTTRSPRLAFEQMRQGHPVLCGNLAEIYAALCEAVGLAARTVNLSVAVQNGAFGIDTHVGAEVWIKDEGWLYQDAVFNCYWTVDGKPASALTLHDALMSAKPLSYAPRDASVVETLSNYYLDPRLYFRHISYEYRPGGTVLYYADKRLEPLSLTDKNWIHTSSRVDIERLDTEGNQVTEQRSEISPGIWVQLLDGDLYVRDRIERSPGIRVRSSSGTVEGCAYLHQRAEDMGLFSSRNLAHNPSFRLTSRSNQIADEWLVNGPIEAMTVSGGQAMAALAGGRLWQRIKAKPNGRYLLYARVSVSRGLVNWTLGDPSRRAMSMGTIEPERISEIVSDIVESESGYLDIKFELPSGGAFRVMDVIVAEAPRFREDKPGSVYVVKKQKIGLD